MDSISVDVDASEPFKVPVIRVSNDVTTVEHTAEHRFLSPIESLEHRLYECQIKTNQDKFFIPKGTLDRVLDFQTIQQALQELVPSRSTDDTLLEAKIICAPSPSYRKIFTILVLADMADGIFAFLEHAIDDSYLPMPDPQAPSETGRSTDSNLWSTILGQRRSRRHLFFMVQWSVLAPFFDRGEDNDIRHYSFSHHTVLPFLDRESITTATYGGSPTPKQSDSEVSVYGGFSEVRQIVIHPDHYDFGDYGVYNPDHIFALKQLYTHDKSELWREARPLKRFRHNRHLVQLLATFEIHRDIRAELSTNYFMVFPWALGDLRSFWETKSSLVGNADIALWISQQCAALTEALSYVHQDVESENDFEIKSEPRAYGRHGDIKPANILWFPCPPDEKAKNSIGQLVLSDFGLAELHRAMSRSAEGAVMFRSPTYRPPESDIVFGPITRKWDIWSLGCTFLEFITWFLMGVDAVYQDFGPHRAEIDVSGIEADTFFSITSATDISVATVKPSVIDWIERLKAHENCSRYIADFLDVIENRMLVVEPKERASAFELTRTLRSLHERCQGEREYFQQPFRQSLRHVNSLEPAEAHSRQSIESTAGSDEQGDVLSRRIINYMDRVRTMLRTTER